MLVRMPVWFVLTSILLVTLLKWVPVCYTPLMLKRSIQFRSEEDYQSARIWVPLEDYSPELVKAVLAAEDSRFFEHGGFDWDEVAIMWREHKENGNRLRGCSTISQQTAKNVFTFSTKTAIRKVLETYWTVLIEKIWGKRRILEVYLNVVEMGRGIYGMETAARHYYHSGVKDLDCSQAAALAVCLPSPLSSNPVQPDAALRRRYAQVKVRASRIQY